MSSLTDPRLLVPGPMVAECAGRTDCAAQDTAARAYLQALTWAFTFFNSARVLGYLPTLWAIHARGDASQHALLTWLTWTGANVTMAAWVYEHNGHRLNPAIVVNACNAAMCAATTALILLYRV